MVSVTGTQSHPTLWKRGGLSPSQSSEPAHEPGDDRSVVLGRSVDFRGDVWPDSGGGHWRWVLSTRTRSPGFEVNDMGYMRGTDTITSYLWLDYREYNPGNIFRDYDVSLLLNYSSNFAWARTGTGASLEHVNRKMRIVGSCRDFQCDFLNSNSLIGC